MPLVSQNGVLIVEVVDGVMKLGTSEECCCYYKKAGCIRPARWRIVEAGGDEYATGLVAANGDLNDLPSQWTAYWYTKTELSMKLEVEYPKEGWKELEAWESTIEVCGDGPFASHAWGDIQPLPDPAVPPWPQPEPYNCAVLTGDINAEEDENGPEWWCYLPDQAAAIAGEIPCQGCWRGVPPIPPGEQLENIAQKFGSAEECVTFCCGEFEPDCIPCYLQPGTPYEVKVPPPGSYTFDGNVDGEWHNARNWFDEYDLAPTSFSLTLSEDVTTLTGSVPVLHTPGGATNLVIQEGVKLAIEVTASPVNGLFGGGGYVACFGEIAAVGECEGKGGRVNGFVYFFSGGHLSGSVYGAAGFRDNSFTNSGAVLSASDQVSPQIDGYSNGWFVFSGNSTNKSGCDSSGATYLAFAGNAKNQAVVGNEVEFWENSRNDATGVTGAGAYFNGRNVESGDSLYDSINVGQGSMPRTGGNYGTVGGDASFFNDSDNYNIVTGNATFDDADNETAGEVQGNGDFQNSANNKGIVVGDGSFDTAATNATTGVVQGNGDFEGDSQNLGTVWGDASFSNDGGTASNGGTVQDNAEFFNEATNAAGGTVQGDATLYGSASNAGNVVGNADFTQFSYNDGGTVGGDATFVDSSEGRSGEITGNATFSGSSNSGGTEAGTLVVGGDATYSGTSQNLGTLQAAGAVTFQSGTSNYGTVAGDATFEAGATNYGTVEGVGTFNGGTNAGTVEGNADFTAGASNSGTVQGDATFEAASTNSGTVNGTASFTGASSNSGEVEGNATFETGSSSNGIVGGTALFDASTHNADGEVAGATTFQNASANYGRVLSTSLFDSSTNEVGGQVLADATFQNGSANNGTVALAATLNDTSTNAGAVGNGSVFNGSSENMAAGSVQGSATFNGSSTNNGSVTGNATFNGSSNNFGTVLGTKTCNTTGTC